MASAQLLLDPGLSNVDKREVSSSRMLLQSFLKSVSSSSRICYDQHFKRSVVGKKDCIVYSHQEYLGRYVQVPEEFRGCDLVAEVEFVLKAIQDKAV